MVEFVNKNTIPIYVNADQRYDLTRQYLEGGWPSTTVMTPGRERLFGFSGPRPVENMLVNLNNAVEYVKTHESDFNVSYNYEEAEIRIPSEAELKKIIVSYGYYPKSTHALQIVSIVSSNIFKLFTYAP